MICLTAFGPVSTMFPMDGPIVPPMVTATTKSQGMGFGSFMYAKENPLYIADLNRLKHAMIEKN